MVGLSGLDCHWIHPIRHLLVLVHPLRQRSPCLGTRSVSVAVLLATREIERKVRLRNTELEERQKLWRWFLLGTLAILLVETWLAGWTTRRPPAPEAVAT